MAERYWTPLPRPVKPAGTVLVTAAADMSAGALEAGAASELRPAKPEPVHCSKLRETSARGEAVSDMYDGIPTGELCERLATAELRVKELEARLAAAETRSVSLSLRLIALAPLESAARELSRAGEVGSYARMLAVEHLVATAMGYAAARALPEEK